MTPHKIPPLDHSSEIIKINLYLGYSVILAGASMWIWPNDPRWWAFYGLSVILSFSATGLVISALRLMVKLHNARRRWKTIQELGNAPKNARLASKDILRGKGMN